MVVTSFSEKHAEEYCKMSSSIRGYYVKDLFSKVELKAGYKCLDIGCGTGNITASLAEKVGVHGNVIACDPDEKRLAVAKRQYQCHNLTFTLGTLSHMEVEENSLDFVLCNAVYHWMPWEEKLYTTNKVFRGLKAHGTFALNIIRYLPTNVRNIASYFCKNHLRNLNEMFRFQNEDEYRSLFTNAGYEIILFENQRFEIPVPSLEFYLDWIDATLYGLFHFKHTYKAHETDIEICQFPNGEYCHQSEYFQIILRKPAISVEK